MNKPRLCEILGIEVDKPFYFHGTNCDLFKISGEGILMACYLSNNVWEVADVTDLCKMINSGIPLWTEDDVEAAKAIRWLIPLASKIGWDGGVKAVLGEFEDKVLLDLPPKFFPNLRPGETVRLKEILEGDEENAD